jgi:dolichol-phosphate mannosyltransferase
MKKHRISIIIPVLNLEEVLEENIVRIKKYVKNPDILLLWDVTKPELEKKILSESKRLAKKYHARTVFRFNQKGFGSALRLGFKHVKGDLIVITMADLCDDPATINEMAKKIDEGFDVVAGSRYSKGGGIVGYTFKQWISSNVSRMINIFSTVKCRDITNAFKMYKKEVLENVETTSNSFDISAELTLKAAQKGYKISQVPTVWKNRNVGQSNFNVMKEAKRYFKMFLFATINMPSAFTKLLLFVMLALLIYGIVFWLI